MKITFPFITKQCSKGYEKIFLSFLFLAIGLNSFSQITYEDGYIITSSNKKVECQIKYLEWKDNPVDFNYKLPKQSEIINGIPATIKEFGVPGMFKYQSHKVLIDRSSNTAGELGKEFRPEFNEEQLFLKVLVEGEASLYGYRDENLVRYFYSKKGSKIEQLIYKRYMVTDLYYGDKVAENKSFRGQLWNNLRCKTSTLKETKRIDYNKKDLIDYVVKYNDISSSEYTLWEKKQQRDLFNLSIRPRVNVTSPVTMEHIHSKIADTNFGNHVSFGCGLETEFILPYNKNKWAIIIESTFQYIKAEKEKESRDVSGGHLVVKMDNKFIEFPFGIRYYFFLNEKSKLFLNSGYVLNLDFNSSINFERKDGSALFEPFDINTGNNLLFGAGYNFQNKYRLEIRYQTSKEFLSYSIGWETGYEMLSVIFGVTLF